ncbi:MAG TPA: transposase [Nonomuraea sp.]|nr:transposase [Nonomuraea sp.]
MDRGDLTNAEWGRLQRLLPMRGMRRGSRSDYRRMIDAVLYHTRTGVHWRDLPERYGCWIPAYQHHRRWSADGTWQRLLTELQAIEEVVACRHGDLIALGDGTPDSSGVRGHDDAAHASRAAPADAPGHGRQLGRSRQGDRILASLRSRLAAVVHATGA